MTHTPGFYLIEAERARAARKDTEKRIELAKKCRGQAQQLLETVKKSGYNPAAFNEALRNLFMRKDAVSEAFKMLNANRNDYSAAQSNSFLMGETLVDFAEELAYLEIKIKQR